MSFVLYTGIGIALVFVFVLVVVCWYFSKTGSISDEVQNLNQEQDADIQMVLLGQPQPHQDPQPPQDPQVPPAF
jgi:Na+-transporting methylmalonyl-CoA/oxaloacetate decarboxylase gamma subunit